MFKKEIASVLLLVNTRDVTEPILEDRINASVVVHYDTLYIRSCRPLTFKNHFETRQIVPKSG